MQEAATRRQPGPVPPLGRGRVGEIVVAGAHGGAGVTTLAVWLRPARDIGVVRRAGPGFSLLHAGALPLVLVARNTLSAAGRATNVVNIISWGGGTPAVLAVVSDSLPEPAEATYRFDLLASRVGAIVRVPFVASLRVTVDPALVDLPRKTRDAIAEIRAVALAVAASGLGHR